MGKPTDIRLTEVRGWTSDFAYRAPIKFGGRVVNDATLYHVEVSVETASGKRARGLGSMPLGNVWAWPSNRLDAATTLSVLRELSDRDVQSASNLSSTAHPLDLCTELSCRYGAIAGCLAQERSIGEPIPALAQLVAASPLEAALFDAQGKALGVNSYDLLGSEFVSHDLSSDLTDDFRGEYLDRYTRREPVARMPLYHLVGALDPLTPAEIAQPVDDGLPESLDAWIQADGLTHLKIKLNGDELAWDVDRVASVERVAAEVQASRGVAEWFYSVDFNERCQDVQYVLDFLAHLRERSPAALERIQYIEQPTHRDLKGHMENRMHEAAKIKPVVIDESLVDLESLLLAQELGYSGVALKACKGHREALLMGAAAQKHGMFLCVQDLTCVGYSFLHSASIAARVPTVAAIEGNGRQYCPAGNRGWEERYPGMFDIHDGTVPTESLVGSGLFGAESVES